MTLKVSVCIVDTKYSDELANSIESTNNQNYTNLQIVPLVDNSLSLSEARNQAASDADGDILLFLDSDAFFRTDYTIQEIVSTFTQNETVKLISMNIQPTETTIPEELYWLVGSSHESYDKQSAIGAAFAIRNDAFQSVNGFDTKFGFDNGHGYQGEDTDLSYEIRKQYGEDSVSYATVKTVGFWRRLQQVTYSPREAHAPSTPSSEPVGSGLSLPE